MVSNEADRVAASGDHLHSHTTEVFLRFLNILWGYAQDPLGWLRVISPRRSLHHKVTHMILQGFRLPPCACVVRISLLRYIEMSGAELTNEQEDPNAIHDHGQGNPPGSRLPCCTRTGLKHTHRAAK